MTVTGVAYGDSIAALAVTGSTSWLRKANAIAGNPTTAFVEEGTGGDTTAQILARVGDVIADNPTYVVVEGGGNDGPSASTITNLASIYAALAAARIPFIATTICPSTSITTAGQKTAYNNANAWIRAHCSDYAGAVLCDWDSAIRDAPLYTWKAGYDLDGVHPNATGEAAMATPLAASILTVLGLPD